MPYRRAGDSGLKLPALSLGLWHNFGSENDPTVQRDIILRAFDFGITHFDLANNYGPPEGAAELAFGRVLKQDLWSYRDEIVVTTKAGYHMWAGPYGEFGSAKHLRASLDQSLRRLGVDYVDLFYSHRPDDRTPLEETMAALTQAVHHGKALYLGISNCSPVQAQRAFDVVGSVGGTITVYQPRYSLFDRSAEEGVFETGIRNGAGAVVFSPLAQGLLSDRYLEGLVPPGSRADSGRFLSKDDVDENYLRCAHALSEIAKRRGQTLSHLALSWVLRESAVASAIIGASSVAQLESNLDVLTNLSIEPGQLDDIDRVLTEHPLEL